MLHVSGTYPFISPMFLIFEDEFPELNQMIL